ncbi:MAG: tyrosine-type recombinase/integrase [Clostridia bacterium]|nr:tyrosine-type recombinase/integrase [Clostridia bacterium]
MKYTRSNSGGLAASIQQEQAEQQKEESRKRRAARSTGAHTSMPIEDMRMVDKWLTIAREHDEHRNRGGISWYLLLLLGFNTALRIGDICQLRVRDVRDQERVRVIADKTDKLTNIPLQETARKAIGGLLRGLDAEDYVLTSRQKGRKDGRVKPVSRQRCYAIVQEIAKRAGFTEQVGCHTMRKTFALNFYRASGGDLAKLQKVLNHSSQEATLHYLGLDQKAIDNVVHNMHSMV